MSCGDLGPEVFGEFVCKSGALVRNVSSTYRVVTLNSFLPLFPPSVPYPIFYISVSLDQPCILSFLTFVSP